MTSLNHELEELKAEKARECSSFQTQINELQREIKVLKENCEFEVKNARESILRELEIMRQTNVSGFEIPFSFTALVVSVII